MGVSTTNDYGVVYAYSKVNDTGTVGSTKRRSGVRRTTSKLQYAGTDKQQINYAYDSSGSLLDDDAGRVTRLTLGASSPPDVAEYRYLGAGRVIDTKLSEPSLVNRLHDGSSPAVYANYLDRFNRVASSRWVKSSGTYYRVDLSYDDNSNMTLAEDERVTPTCAAQAAGRHVFLPGHAVPVRLSASRASFFVRTVQEGDGTMGCC